MFGRVAFKNLSKKAEREDTDPDLLKKNVVMKQNQDIHKEYDIQDFLGSGKFGEVKRCQEKKSGGYFAAKFIPVASDEDLRSVENEVAIMNKLRHPRLIQLYDAFICKSEAIMVLELITGGELFERIIDESFDLNEARCVRFMNEILQGVEYIHNQGVLHLDLKPENILCLSATSFKIKIIDFGFARFYDGQEICVLFGTPEFVSPEVVSYEPVTPAADMWSVGVICYVMLSGLSPFMGDSEGETLANILKVVYDFDYPEFDEISEQARDFIQHLLIKNPRKRMTATECLQHPWLKKKTILKRKGTVSKKRLKHFVYRRKWQKAVNAIIALLRMGVVLHHSPELDAKNASHGVKAPLTSMVNSAQKNTVKEPPAKITKIDKPPPLQENNQRKVSFESGNPSSTVQSPSRKSSATTEAATPPPNKAKRSKSKAISLLRRLSGKVDIRPSKEKYQPSEDSIQELGHLDESCPGKTTPVDPPKSKQKTENNPTSSSPLRFLNLSKKSTITRKTSKQSDTSISTASPPSSVENSNPESPLSPVNSSLVKNKSTSSADTTVGMPTEGSKPSSKPGLHFGPKSSGEPSQSKPLSKMRAPVTGGIAAKIGFFANLTRNESHK